eukprot:6479504-Amphidinium_carterae.1
MSEDTSIPFASTQSSEVVAFSFVPPLPPLSASCLAKAARDSSTTKRSGIFWVSFSSGSSLGKRRRPRPILLARHFGSPPPPESVWSSDPSWLRLPLPAPRVWLFGP